MRAPYPPGDTSWRSTKPHSAWREFKFALNQITRSIEPTISLTDMLTNWNKISESLAESPRKRKSQLEAYFEH